MAAQAFGEVVGQGWWQLGELALAFVLSALIGLEREARQKSAGLRTHALVGIGAALFVVVSKYGFSDVLITGRVVLDPSRMAAQIVSGIGFIGGGLIFVRRDAVRGLTTAAVVWVTAAVGSACGAGLPILAVAVTAGHFLVIYGLTPIARRIPRSRVASSQLRLVYRDRRGVLRTALETCTGAGFTVTEISTERVSETDGERRPVEPGRDDRREQGEVRAVQRPVTVAVVLVIQGAGSITALAAQLQDLSGILAVSAGDVHDVGE